jgi:hypothetical protein
MGENDRGSWGRREMEAALPRGRREMEAALPRKVGVGGPDVLMTVPECQGPRQLER